MSFDLQHILVSEQFTPAKQTSGEETFFRANKQGQFAVLYPGTLRRRVNASFSHRMRVNETPGPGTEEEPGPHPLHGGFETVTHSIPLQLKIFTPKGAEFTATQVTLADLRKFRDLRGSPRGSWSYKLSGESTHFSLDPDETIFNPRGVLGLELTETVQSESAPLLIPNAPVGPSHQSFRFDLFRVGTFIAELTSLGPLIPWHGSMRLLDPDGGVVARTANRQLRCEIGLASLRKSRDAEGRPREWTLEISPQGGVVVGNPRLSATVIAAGRIGTAVMHDRITKILGPSGSFVRLFGENRNGLARARLEVTDVVAAETIDMHGLLDKAIRREEQEPPATQSEFNPNMVYTLYQKSENLKLGTKLDVSTMKVDSIDVSVGPGDKLGAAVPAAKLKVRVSGKVKVNLGPVTIADAEARDGTFRMEVGIKLGPDGTPGVVVWVPEDPLDIDLNWTVVLGLGVVAGPLIAFGAAAFGEYLEHEINDKFAAGARELFADPLIAPRILMTIFGAHLSYRRIRIESGEILFEHIAPLEPDPKRREGYAGVIGRRFDELGPGINRFTPRTLGDTWAAGNLAKIDHVVAVMMENRSYDHVLGYRAMGSPGDGAEGLNEAVVAAIQAADGGQHKVRALREAGFPPNAVGLMTRIPKSVGHELSDVTEQLAGRAAGPGGRPINDPKGFVDNFTKKIGTDTNGVVPDDVLGYYGAEDLKIYAHFANNYSYCDQYFCSHPGPTLPNRMYSLTGDVQYDRLGVPILDNNHGDNVLLSRAASIYDLLTRRGVSWRVYESAPSVTMLRMFARYATNNVDIVPIDRLEGDIANGNLPAFTYIEPAMHHHPQDDDHPHADMHRGQIFVKRVYDALRSNPAVWQKTLLIVTYDEHGGFYDHVVPPVADLLNVRGPGMGLGGAIGVEPTVSDGGGAAPAPPPLGGGGRGGRVLPGDIAVDLDRVVVADPDPGRTPAPPPQQATMLQIPYGVRVPTFVVSPWTVRGKGPSITLDHCSILKTVLARFGGGEKPFLGDRIHASQSFDAFLTETQPRMDVEASPSLPGLPLEVRRLVSGASATITAPLSRKKMREGHVEAHDVMGFVARMLGR
jgi:phospholipase C